jgi:hypothetical protein
MANNDTHDERRINDDVERLPGVTFTLDDFANEDDFLDFVCGDTAVDVKAVAEGFIKNETVEALEREGWHKSAITAIQVMARSWLAAASPVWVKIESEADLPKDEGRYIFRRRSDGVNVAYPVRIADEDQVGIGAAKKGEPIEALYLVAQFEAWLPIPTYQPEVKENANVRDL